MKNDIIFGVHAAKQMLEQHPDRVLEVWLQEGNASSRLIDELPGLEHLPVHQFQKRKLDEVSNSGNHQGVVLQCKAFQAKNEKQLDKDLKAKMEQESTPLYLVLDNITDPHNLGACLRSAAAANVDGVILPKDKSAPINATVRKVAAGGVESVDIYVVTNLARALDSMKQSGVWLLGTALDEKASSLYQSDLKGPLAIVMGSEGQGLRRLTQEKCDFLCFLPMLGPMQSLNVSVATGICLFEALRQRENL